MSENQYYFINSRDKGEKVPYVRLWSFLGSIADRIGLKRITGWVNSVRTVAEPATRVFMSRRPVHASTDDCGVLSVMSANLWHDWPRFRNIENRLEAFARLVEREHVDLLLLQEMARTPFLNVDSWLAERLNMSYIYSRSNGSLNIGFEEGLGVFSRFPMKRLPYLRQVSSGSNPFIRRMALGVEVETPCGEILAFSAHLGLFRKPNAYQLHELYRWISRLAGDRSAVIGGDFNVSEKSRQIRKVRLFWQDTYHEAQANGHSSTHKIYWPWGSTLLKHRIDYIFLQPGKPVWQIIDVRHLEAPDGPHSDHRAVMARFAPVHGHG